MGVVAGVDIRVAGVVAAVEVVVVVVVVGGGGNGGGGGGSSSISSSSRPWAPIARQRPTEPKPERNSLTSALAGVGDVAPT